MLSNFQIKNLKSLHQKKHRIKREQIVLEGHRLVLQSLILGAKIKKVWVTEDYLYSMQGREVKKLLIEKKIVFEKASMESIQRACNSKNSQGIIALAFCPKYEPQIKTPNYSIFFDNISDPGNLGTLLRTANWFGIESIFLSDDCVDVFNSKVVRSGMGAHFYFKEVHVISLDEIVNNSDDLLVIVGDLSGKSIDEFSMPREKKWILVLGSEAHGISSSIESLITHRITISTHENMESLNVVAAGAILLHHFMR